MKNIIIFLSLLFLISINLPTPVLADSGTNPSCPSIYGANCPTGNLSINKTVMNPQTGQYVDSLSANDPTFLPNQQVNFRIEVKNTGNASMSNIQVEDKFPSYLDFKSGPGSFDVNSKTLTWTIDNLNPGDYRLFDVVGTVNGNGLPTTGLSCLTNFAQAQEDSQVAQDTAVFCVQNQVLGSTTQLPKTGVGNTFKMIGLFTATLSLSVVFAALYLKKLLEEI